MITITLPNSDARDRTGLRITSLACMFGDLRSETEIIATDECFIQHEQCNYINLALAQSGTTEDGKNDKARFIFRKVISADVLALELRRDGVKVADLNDNTFGIFFDFGTLGTTAEQALYSGYEIDWQSVLLLEGQGCYTVAAVGTVLGVANTVIESECWTLKEYRDSLADGTIVLRWIQNGKILSSEFDFTGINWIQYIRLRGIFDKNQRADEEDQIQDSKYTWEPIQLQTIDEWLFETELIPFRIANLLFDDLKLSDETFVTTYNQFNHQDFFDFSIRYSGLDTSTYHGQNTNANFILKFKRRTEDVIKRKFF